MSMSEVSVVCNEINKRIINRDIDKDDLESLKLEVCGEIGASEVPKNGKLLQNAPDEHREEIRKVVQRKPVRTASGVTPVAIMTSPKMCPHGKCLYCPGGPASEFSSSQAYTGDEPAGQRAEANNHDPYGQVMLRLNQLQYIGHPTDKVDLILMGGTMTSRSHDYQEWFVKRALEAMNDFNVNSKPNPQKENFEQDRQSYEFKYVEDVISNNESGDVRCIGITFETKPDWCEEEQIDRMLNLGGTKVEVGVQTTYDRINDAMHRGHGVKESKKANKLLRDSGFKVGFHMMPGQPGMTEEMCLEDFDRIFSNPDWKPDYLKIYPTLVVKGTRIYDMWKRGEYEPLDNNTAAQLIAEIKDKIPKYVRLQRVQRDIPADNIEGGVWKSNLRQLARKEMKKHGWSCDCIRCREVGHSDMTPENLDMDVMTYYASGGIEKFISIEDFTNDILIGFCRLRLPAEPHRRELKDAGIVRELHVYGNETTIGMKDNSQWQHKGFGKQLMAKAEEITEDAGYNKISVISGIGARKYYKDKLGYYQDGPYVSKNI